MATTKKKANADKKVSKVMHEFKEGTLRSSNGAKVKKRDQAVAIAMSESGQSKPERKPGKKKTMKK